MPRFGLDVGGTQAKLAMLVEAGEGDDRAGWVAWRFAVEAALRERLGLGRGQGHGPGHAPWGKWEDDPVPVGRGGTRPSATGAPGTLHFFNFRTSALEDAPLSWPSPSASRWDPLGGDGVRRMRVSGGGAYKLEDQIKRVFGLDEVERVDELESLVRGLAFVATESANRDEIFVCTNARFAGMLGEARERLETAPHDLAEPFLLCNIGSGVSFVDCDLARGVRDRVGGSSLGGGTFHGLVTLLTGENDFDAAVDAATKGDSAKVDLLVGDIYGEGGADKLGLRASILASSFGRMATSASARAGVTKGDLALSVLVMIGLNLSAMACLHARLCQRDAVLFTGNFLSGASSHAHKRNTLAVRVFAYGVDFWSQGKMRALFLRTQGDLGALGALVGASPSPSASAPRNAAARL